MNKAFFKESILLIGSIIAIILISIFIKKYFFLGIDLEKIPLTLELNLKKIIKAQININSAAIKRKKINSAVKKIMRRFQNQMEELPYDVEIIIIDAPIINAAAFPGGLIVLFSGLIKKTDSPEELASVLAHELGHVAYRDPIKKLGREFSLGILLSLGGGQNSMVIIKKIMKSLASNAFSRKQEARADDYAHELMIKSGLKPKHFAVFMNKLVDKTMDEKTMKLLAYITSHPDLRSRIKKAEKKSGLFRGEENKFKINWERVKSSLP